MVCLRQVRCTFAHDCQGLLIVRATALPTSNSPAFSTCFAVEVNLQCLFVQECINIDAIILKGVCFEQYMRQHVAL